ncbi:GDNF-inducible zinc finger protein 1-like [Haliotis asinina]|uniref:GDNF-inducible zinc finger protein 1-like n=1 Tax=Haliotis asinina TaxID=109174 RepID=UPI0035318104
MMTRIFSNVVADIDKDLQGKFPTDFDYHAMVKKVSEDAGVEIQTGDGDSKQISLQGVWVAMEKVHSLLATTLAVYGARVVPRDTPSPSPTQDFHNQASVFLKSGLCTVAGANSISQQDTLSPVTQSETEVTTSNHDRMEVKGECVVTVMKPKYGKHVKKRKAIKSLTLPKSESTVTSTTTKTHAHHVANFTNNCSVDESEPENLESFDLENVEVSEQSVKRKRGRPRKHSPGLPSQRIFTKFRSKFNHRKKYTRLKRTIHDDGVKSSRGRGRPRKFPEGDPEEFPCPECDFVAKNRNTLGDHRHRVHLANPTKCDVCHKVFPNRRYMKRHRASHVEPQHCCDVCGKMYKIRKAMQEHKKTHEEGYSRPTFQCGMCPKSFCSNYILSCHVKSEHLGQKKSFLCSVCGKSFTTKHSLQEHSNAHTGAKPHICEVCGKGFCYESALRDHKYVHIGAKQFICEICSKGFSQRSGLKMHMRIHEQKKQFVCSDCGREFTQKQALQRHERVHKGDKPFICKLCSRTFSDASIIRRHMILVHKIHKDAKTWREDIICKVQGALNYHVEKISEIEDKIDNQDSTTSTEMDVLAAAAKAVELPLVEGPGSPEVVRPSNSGYNVYKPDVYADVSLSNPGLQEEQSVDQPGHRGIHPASSSSSEWYNSLNPELKQLQKPEFTQDKHGSSSYLETPHTEHQHSQTAYMDPPSRPHSHEALQQKSQDHEIPVEGQMGRTESPTHPYLPLHQDSRFASNHNNRYTHNAHVDRGAQYTTDSCQDGSSLHAPFVSDPEKIDNSIHYPEPSNRGDRVSLYPSVNRERVGRQAQYPQENPDERPSSYPPDTPPTRTDPSTSGSSSNNFPTSPQPWPSMYAYYSHLANQFGMTLSDYAYMANSGNSHQ